MLEYVLNTSTNVFCPFYCPRREVLRRGAVLRSICQASWPSPTTTLDRKRTLKEGVMFDDLRALLFVLVVWIEMDVIVNAFPMKGAILVRRIWTAEKDV